MPELEIHGLLGDNQNVVIADVNVTLQRAIFHDGLHIDLDGLVALWGLADEFDLVQIGELSRTASAQNGLADRDVFIKRKFILTLSHDLAKDSEELHAWTNEGASTSSRNS